MTIPDYIEEQIERRFHGRFRLRWSDADQMFHYEQKVRRGIAEGFVPIATKSERHFKSRYDDQIRGRDGYVLVMKIAPGTQTRCTVCHGDISIPAFKSAQVNCGFCASKGRRSSFVAGYFPLSDSLLDELERIDPDRGGNERVFDAQRKAELFREREQEWNLTAPAEAAFRERFNRLVGIPQVGLSGKTSAWTDAPESKKTYLVTE
jgi:hypothetical protein